MAHHEAPLILLVEDDRVTAKLQTRLLENYGYRVVHAPSGEEGVTQATSNRDISMVLMDIDLGEGKMNGTQAAREILAQRTLPLLFLSSHTEKEVVALTEQITNYGYVVKTSGITVLDASIKMAFKLFEEKMKNSLILTSVSEGILGLDLKGQITFVNRAAQKILGYREEDLLGRRSHDILHRKTPDFPGVPEEECGACLSLKDRQERHVLLDHFIDASGEVHPVEYTVSPIMDQKTHTGTVLAFSDISDQFRIRELEDAHRRRKALGELAHGVGNDYQNLLSSLFGAVEMAAELNQNPLVAQQLDRAREVLELSKARTQQLIRYAVGTEEPIKGVPPSEDDAGPAPPPSTPEGKPATVLVLDDNKMMLETFSEMLTALGYTPCTAYTGEKLLQLFHNLQKEGVPVKAVILDHHLAGGDDARQLAATLKALSPGLKIYITSGTEQVPSMRDPQANGFNGRLMKPFFLRELSSLLA